MMKRLPLFRILLALALCLVLACPAQAEEDTFVRQFDASLTDYFAELDYPTTEAWVSTPSSCAMYAACILTDANQLEDVNWDLPVILTWELEYPVLNYIDTAQNLCELGFISDEIWNGILYMTPIAATGWMSAEPTWDEIAKRFEEWSDEVEYAYVNYEDYLDAMAAIDAAFEDEY